MDKKWSVWFKNEWSQLNGSCNWYDFTLIHLSFMNDKMLGSYEFNFDILGFGIHVTYVHQRAEFFKKIVSDVEEIKALTDDELKAKIDNGEFIQISPKK